MELVENGCKKCNTAAIQIGNMLHHISESIYGVVAREMGSFCKLSRSFDLKLQSVLLSAMAFW